MAAMRCMRKILLKKREFDLKIASIKTKMSILRNYTDASIRSVPLRARPELVEG